MSDVVIKVENLGKRYRIGTREAGYRTFRETLVDAAKAPFLRLHEAWSMAHGAWSKSEDSGPPAPGSQLQAPSSPLSPHSDDFIWALKDVSFEVKQGEVVGIIGRNGAGKSTLLKILSKITEPTEGKVKLHGRVGSLLEVGTGFHPELTGHENIYLYGAILGMDRWEITRKFDEIVAFAELEEFVDTPVKRYSSGMYMRLAFAVAAHLEPEILLVDEVLAVGDAAFQKKCLGKIWEVSHVGRTILFVSHNMVTINALCSRTFLLEKGMIESQGETGYVVSTYEKKLHSLSATRYVRESEPMHGAWVEEAVLKSRSGKLIAVFSMTDAILLYVSIHFKTRMEGLRFAVRITEMNGSPIYHIMNVDSEFDISSEKGVLKFVVRMDNLNLLPNNYLISLDLANSANEALDVVENTILFTVTQDSALCRRNLPRSSGIVFSLATWEIIEKSR